MFKKKLFKNFDWILFIVMIITILYGLVIIGAATNAVDIDPDTGEMVLGNLYFIKRQFIWFIVGLIAMIIIISIDYHVLGNLANYIYVLNLVPLIMVELFADETKGAARWLEIGTIKIQPSEFAKVAIIITLAKLLSKKTEDIDSIGELFLVLLHVGIPMILILKQPDLGTSIVFLVITFFMLYIGGIKYKLLAGLTAAGVVSGVLMFFFGLGKFQKARLLAYKYPEMDKLGVGYNVRLAKTAIGSGQMFGQGLFNDNALSKLNFIPEKQTDFIFSVLGESLGFVGCIGLILLYFIMIMRIIRISRLAKDKFGQLIAIGVVSVLMFQIFENIGMNVGIMPVTGIPLPFVSYGGSSLLVSMISIGIVLNVGMRRNVIKF
ncbi:MAG: rod shape-determining protein RodA [Clostridia bacterium]|nr:rod shape-determining protein RodA [Clostridia bacterium]